MGNNILPIWNSFAASLICQGQGQLKASDLKAILVPKVEPPSSRTRASSAREARTIPCPSPQSCPPQARQDKKQKSLPRTGPSLSLLMHLLAGHTGGCGPVVHGLDFHFLACYKYATGLWRSLTNGPAWR